MTAMTLLGLFWPWRKSNASKFGFLLISILLPIFTIGFYYSKGAFPSLQHHWAMQEQEKQAKKELAQLGSTENVIANMKMRLAENPDSSEGWYLLGRLYMVQQDYNNALSALKHAKQLAPTQTNILSSYAESSYFLHHQHLDSESKSILIQITSTDPQQFNAMNLLAIDAYQNKQYNEALQYWQKILQQLPPQSQDARMIHAMMQRALTHGHTDKPTVVLHISVTMSNEIKSKVTPNDKVFIYAQAVSGPAMPLAVVQVTVKDLPINITLDESMAMVPDFNLTKFQFVKIVARISKSGQAIAQTGDWQGISGIINTKQKQGSIHLLINSAI